MEFVALDITNQNEKSYQKYAVSKSNTFPLTKSIRHDEGTVHKNLNFPAVIGFCQLFNECNTFRCHFHVQQLILRQKILSFCIL